MTRASTIAIDGTAASGKSTIGEMLARRLGYLYLDTGAMYRAVALAALRSGMEIANEEKVSRLAQSIRLEILPPDGYDDGRQYNILLDGEDVTWSLRTPEVNAVVSQVSTYPGVRRALTRLQRRIGQHGKVVMVGRDIGTVVMPDADLKLFLDASPEERAHRRHKEMAARGVESSFDEVLRWIMHRDQIDSCRDIAPLRPADDAVIIDTTNMSVEEVFEKALKLAEDP